MLEVSIDEAAPDLQTLLEQVAIGREVILVKQGKVIARLVPPQTREQYLASAKELRDSLHIKGEPLSTTVIKARQEEHN
jgi:antitoxin (DNA-binding transcriptional repressor) of toxin-antitoxin stability system